MKKFLALLLTVAMVFAMAACSAPAAEETKPAEEGAAAPAEETSDKPAAAGSVYYKINRQASEHLVIFIQNGNGLIRRIGSTVEINIKIHQIFPVALQS